MGRAVLFAPSDAVIDASLGARQYLDRLARAVELETRPYEDAGDAPLPVEALDSVAVLAGLSALELNSGYVEMDLDTVFTPQELLRTLRAAVGPGFALVTIVDDAYSDYVMASYLKAGASAVVGTGGALFGIVTSRIPTWDAIVPYINAFTSI